MNVTFVPTAYGPAVTEGESRPRSAPEVGEVFNKTSMLFAAPIAMRSASLSPLRSCAIGWEDKATSKTGGENEPSPFPKRILVTRVVPELVR